MIITFKSLELENFKSHQNLKVEFGDLTQITGDNGLGKSSILEAITFLVYGTDAFNSKIDPTPITYDSEQTMVSLLLNVDGKDLLLGRSLKNGKISFYINEVPTKATEFNELVEQLFDKELFFSLFNPSYFFTLHWEKQRGMLLKYVSAPGSTEILKHMKEEQSKCLKPLLMKNPIGDVQKIYSEKKRNLDKAYIQAQTRTKTLKEQLEQLANTSVPLESIKAELAQIDKEVRAKEAEHDEIWDKNKAFNDVQNEFNRVNDLIRRSKDAWPALKNEVIDDTCKTCKRPLEEESLKAVKEDHENRMANYKTKHNSLLEQRKALKARLDELEFIDSEELRKEIKVLDESGVSLRAAIENYKVCQRASEQINQAEVDEQETLKQLKESIFVLDCIKAFKAQEAELQAEKVQALFTTLSVRLFKQNKGDGEHKPDFEIVMDGKPYRALSLSESVRAGLELREVLSNQSSLVMPTFVDNAESITRFKEPTGQLIVSRVVAGQELKIEGATLVHRETIRVIPK